MVILSCEFTFLTRGLLSPFLPFRKSNSSRERSADEDRCRTFVRTYTNPPDPCAIDPNCINIKTPLLNNVRRGLIDPDTPSSAMTKTSVDGTTLQLVVSVRLLRSPTSSGLMTQFSDEFNTDGRTFYPGDDPYFTAVDIWYGVTQDLEVSSIPGYFRF